MNEKGILGDFPGPEEIGKAESAMTAEQRKLSEFLLADTRRYLRKALDEARQGNGDPRSIVDFSENYWNEQLKKYPGNEDLLFLREICENVRKINEARISDVQSPVRVLEDELKKLDEAFGPETEEERKILAREVVEDFMRSQKSVNLDAQAEEEPQSRKGKPPNKWVN